MDDFVIQKSSYYVRVNSIFHNICSYEKDQETIYASIDGAPKIINIVPKDKFINVLKEIIGTTTIRYISYKNTIHGPQLDKLDYYKVIDKIDSGFYREISDKNYFRIKNKHLFTKLKLMA